MGQRDSGKTEEEIKDIRNIDVPLKFKILESDMDLKTKSIAIGNVEITKRINT